MKVCLRMIALLLLVTITVLPACKKGGGDGGGGGGNNEANLVVTTNPAAGSVQAPSLGPFNVTVSITSAMPPNGVKIDITARKDDGSNPPAFYTQTTNSSAAGTNFSITNTPAALQCIVEVKVTSLTRATNQWTGTYRYSSK